MSKKKRKKRLEAAEGRSGQSEEAEKDEKPEAVEGPAEVRPRETSEEKADDREADGQPGQMPSSSGEAPDSGPRWRRVTAKVLLWLLPILFFGYVFGVCMNYALNDPDIWWHLKTGDYILKNWDVPENDPFSYTTPRPLSEGQRIGLRSQWLGQIMYLISYRITDGLLGVALFRNLLIILPMLILYVWFVRRRLPAWISLAVVAMPALMFAFQLFYSFERPQGISFGLATLAVVLLERVRRKTINPEPWDESPGRRVDPSYWLLPVLMGFWSNIHAGFIVGIVIICMYAFFEALRLGYHRLRGGSWPMVPATKVFFIVCGVALLATVLNPNWGALQINYLSGLAKGIFKDLFVGEGGIKTGGGGWVSSVVLEYKSLMYFYKNLQYDWLIFYWIFTGLIYLVLFYKYYARRSVDLAELAVVSFITFFANYYARGLMFSLAILPLFLGKSLLQLHHLRPRHRLTFKGAVALVLVLLLNFTVYSYNRAPIIMKPGVAQSWISPWYPVRMVGFLKENRLKPPMYNFYTWGGFLIWTLYPQYQVFIDGRALDDLINRTADSILKTYPGWRRQLDAYNINFVVTPAIFRESGHIIPLAMALAEDDDWKLIFAKNNGLVFIRDVPQNKDLIYKYNTEKSNVYREIVQIENLLLIGNPRNPVYHLAKADALMALGKYREAKAIYERFPSQSRDQLRRLKALGY